MNGTEHYNQGVRAHKLASEAFQRVRFLKFLERTPEEETKEIQDLISELHSRFPTKDYRQISLIFIRKTTGFYRFRLFSFRVLQIPAFLIPGFTDFGFSHSRYNSSGFSHSRFYRFRLFSFRVLQILESLYGNMILTSRAQWKKSGKFLSAGRLD
jgi:hypothetical protein